ncbi:hypothetical protein [Thiothrix sp.]|jgi:predicted RNA-binding Zn-ribbon protein involved in translation (DUF1610 family)|uniref:hypothetical protein n=1 Tax=Thiothrix sp. TaxID=1032 RepID=UPI002579BC0F|nr:hypothetical protein [Thiothrix sp.]
MSDSDYKYNWQCASCGWLFDFPSGGEVGCCPNCGSDDFEPPEDVSDAPLQQ